MPFGFFGSAAVLVLLSAVVALFYAFVWPASVAKLSLFLPVSLVLAVTIGALLFLWYLSLLSAVGISGAPSMSRTEANTLVETLRVRYAVACAATIAAEGFVCFVLQAILGRNAGA